jgi:small subunit ribosomal protein S17
MAEEKCDDKKCYKHAGLKVRGERLQGKVISAKAKNTVVIEMDRTKFFPKYQRWAKERTHMSAHNPSCIGAKVGDIVTIAETRKLSKTKAWTVLDIVKA